MTPAQFNELQRQAAVIEQNAIYQQKLNEYKATGLFLIITKDQLDEFNERVKYKTWNHLYMIEKSTTEEKYHILFNKKCIEYGHFLSDIFSIGATYGIKFTFNQQKQTNETTIIKR